MENVETYIYEIVYVSYKKISENSRLIEITETNHVFHAFHRRNVHMFDLFLAIKPVFFAIVIDNLYPARIAEFHPGSQVNGKLSFGFIFQPDMVTLKNITKN